MKFVIVAIVLLALIAAGVYLVETEHYGWAWIPFLAIFGLKQGK